jgi:hypothetical protein
VGFVSDCVCIWSYSFGNNTLKWQIVADRKEDAERAIKTLFNRLQDYDKEGEPLQTEYTTEDNTLYQSFFFVEDWNPHYRHYRKSQKLEYYRTETPMGYNRGAMLWVKQRF